MEKRKRQVFVSSVGEEQVEARRGVVETVLRAGHLPVGRGLTPGGDGPLEDVRRLIDGADAFVLVLGREPGPVEPETGMPWSLLEHGHAAERNLPRVALARNGEATSFGSDELFERFEAAVAREVRTYADARELALRVHEFLIDTADSQPQWGRDMPRQPVESLGQRARVVPPERSQAEPPRRLTHISHFEVVIGRPR